MNFNWREYFTLAEGLKAQPNLLGTPEASFRSAASRAYYAAYQCALEYACTEGFEPCYGDDSHKKLQKYFSTHSSPNQAHKDISLQLNRLRDIRVKADYRLNKLDYPETLASSAIGMAKIILCCLDSLSQQNPDL
jgi:uncharacterized protein (UPF0332 family)